MTDIIKKLSVGILLSIILNTNTANAGGDYHHIQITDIKTISKKEHHIIFKVLERENKDYMEYYRQHFPMYNCESVTLKIEYQEWEWDDKISLFLGDLLTLNARVFSLNRTIKALKEKINDKNQKFVLSDIEAFHYTPNSNCELLSKTLELHYQGTYFKDSNYIQPIRHHSRLENRPQK